MDRISSASLKDVKSPQKVEAVAVFILEESGKFSAQDTMKTQEIISKYKAIRKSNEGVVEIAENTLTTTISILSHDPSSRIQCMGKKQGYFVSPLTTQPDDNFEDESSNKKGVLSEKSLYPAMCEWMKVTLGTDQSIDVSSKRGGSKWQNPDILGIKWIDFLGMDKFELITIEVKLSLNEWTQYIFEAISHSMFSNRAYFAYLKEHDYDKVPDRMKLYASRFGIGIITISIDDEERDNIKDAKSVMTALSEGTCIISEEVPATYHIPELLLEKDFLDGLSIKTPAELRNYSE